MTDADFIGYAMDLLDPEERAAVEAHFAHDPDAARQVAHVRAALAPLEADRNDPAPPAGLSSRTVARLAAYLVEHEPRVLITPDTESDSAQHIALSVPYFSADHLEPRAVGGRFRADLIVAAGIGLVAVGLVLSFVNRARYSSERAACQNNLRTLHVGLTGYADTNAGRYPQIGTAPYPTAGSFVSALADAGQCPPGFRAICPAGPPSPPPGPFAAAVPVAYTYSLGHRTPDGVVIGLWRSDRPNDENDLIPVSADYPAPTASTPPGPTSPHRIGQNVLFAGGNVRFATLATVGVNGDDIYRNLFGQVAAGVDRDDAVLGRAEDRP